MRIAAALLAYAMGLAAPVIGACVALHRVNRVETEARHRAIAVNAALEALSSRRSDDYGPALEACRDRTESLHGVLEVLVSSGIGWPQRVRLPDPPPGWAKWPELGHRDRPDEPGDVDEEPAWMVRR